jgi:NAD(P)-dependent dehydrogenase (short-subunit alcohol dehydrogenase family)
VPVAIVTGGNSGIGRAAAVDLAARGFDLGITWHSEEDRAHDTAREIEGAGRRCEVLELDLHDVGRVQGAVDDLAGRLGGLDALVNNAGYGSGTPVLDMTLDEWQGVVDVDLTAAFLAAQAAGRRMRDTGTRGAIVNVTSVHEHIPLRGGAPYVAAKHGLGGLTKLMALELAEHGIRVNAVAPGQIATRMTGQEDEAPEPSDGIPLGRAGTAHEIGALIAWLCSDEATYVTGSSFVVDGGLMLTAAEDQ